MKHNWLLFLSFLLLTACSSLPKELETSAEQIAITDYQQWMSQKTIYTDQDVRLGGVVNKVTNLKDQTRIEITNLPISKTGRPDINQDPNGRFVAYFDGFLDPINFPKGKLVTVVGKTMPPEKGKIGDYDYTFPVMKAYGKRLWNIEETTYVTPDYWYPNDCMYRNRRGDRPNRFPCRMMNPSYIYTIKEVR